MRVLVVTPWFPSARHPGAGIFNQRDVELLAADHEIRVLHLIRPDWYAPGEGAPGRYEVTRVPFSARNLRSWLRARKSIRAELSRADLVHTMAFPALLPFSGVRVRVPWVHTEHWSGLTKPVSGLTGAVKHVVFRRLRQPDVVVAVSEALAWSMRRWCRVSPCVIENAVPLPAPGKVASPPRPNERVRLVAVGSISAHKGTELAVETVAELVRRGVDAELRWIGTGADEAAAAQAAQRLGVADRVLFCGQLERPELESELLGSHVFVLPTASETFGIAIAEALACGLPVVTSGTGGHVQLLDGFSAARLAERTAVRLADAVESVLADDGPDLRVATATAARERFSTEARSAEYAGVYASAARPESV